MTPAISNIQFSVITNFYNMTREAARTLYTLTPGYQMGVAAERYEVIALDNGSTYPLNRDHVLGFGSNYRYVYADNQSPSPCKAINAAARNSNADWLICCIDGARMLSPGILNLCMAATRLADHPFIYTMGMHIGAKPQNILVDEGYNQSVEDELLETIDWKADGYRLFDISCLAYSANRGFFSSFNESNCFCLKREDFLAMGGFDEAFDSPGGGLVNLDFFNRIHEDPRFSPVLLLGEATFHQFHGGVATNKTLKEHPWQRMHEEYQRIRGKDFRSSISAPYYFGQINDHALPFLYQTGA